jgi:hypothetical protein
MSWPSPLMRIIKVLIGKNQLTIFRNQSLNISLEKNSSMNETAAENNDM